MGDEEEDNTLAPQYELVNRHRLSRYTSLPSMNSSVVTVIFVDT